MRGAAWAAPVVVVAAAAPLAAATTTNVGAYSIAGTCGPLGGLQAGFVLTADVSEPLPIGTVIDIGGTGTGIDRILGLIAFPSIATITEIDLWTRRVTLVAPLPAGAALTLHTAMPPFTTWSLWATVTLPTGYTSSGAKSTANVDAVSSGEGGQIVSCSQS